MPERVWSAQRERQDEDMKQSLEERCRPEKLAAQLQKAVDG